MSDRDVREGRGTKTKIRSVKDHYKKSLEEIRKIGTVGAKHDTDDALSSVHDREHVGLRRAFTREIKELNRTVGNDG